MNLAKDVETRAAIRIVIERYFDRAEANMGKFANREPMIERGIDKMLALGVEVHGNYLTLPDNTEH